MSEEGSRITRRLKKTGEPPAIIDSIKTNKSVKNLRDYYFVNGWFDREVNYQLDTLENKRAKITYKVKPGKPYFIDTVTVKISSPLIDSLYQMSKKQSFIKYTQEVTKIQLMMV